MQAAKEGDQEAIAALIRVTHRPLRAFVGAMILGPQDADDVAQEVFLRALERLDYVETVDMLGPFLRGIARNVIREQQRKFVREGKAYQKLIEERMNDPASAVKESWLSDPELVVALRSCIEKLSDRARAMLVGRYSDERNSDEIGAAMGMTGPAVRTAMRRARGALLKCIRTSHSPAIEATE